MSKVAFGRSIIGEGDTYRERLRIGVPCPDCGVEMMTGYLTDHRRWIHGTDPDIDWYRLTVIQHEHLTQAYEVRFLRDSSKCQHPFSGCPR